MKMIAFEKGLYRSFGVLTDLGIVDIVRNWPGRDKPAGICDILAGGEPAMDVVRTIVSNAERVVNIQDVKILAPIPRPGKVLALAGNYSRHIKECGLALGFSDSPRETTTPRPFIMPSTVVVGDDCQIDWPAFSDQIDYEAELCIVIGKAAKCVSIDDASGYIAGFCIANDISARSVTFKENRDDRPWDEFYDWLNGKWADGFLPMGPWITTVDEIDDVQNLEIELKVNGQIRQKSNTSFMIFSAYEIVSFLSHIMTLEPGDIICTGTPEGVGHATSDYLKAGDKIECQIQNLGKLTSTLGPKPKKMYKPLAKG